MRFLLKSGAKIEVCPEICKYFGTFFHIPILFCNNQIIVLLAALGFDIDLAKALGKQMGYKVELVNLGFDGLIPALSTGNIDLAVSGMSITEERKNAVDFCDPYYTSGLIVLVRPDETNIKGINDLAYADSFVVHANVWKASVGRIPLYLLDTR